ncbi:MAG: RpiB/LacA/LacB family sugar-phosphate isomerase [Rhodospirillaceae bacterium]
MTQRTVAIACDHAGFALKSLLKSELEQAGHAVVDLGTNSVDSVDYPDFGHAMAAAIGEGRADTGVLVCGSGIGISIAANRHPEVRAALVHDALGARMSRLQEVAKDCLKIFLDTEFEGGRHARRVAKLDPSA